MLPLVIPLVQAAFALIGGGIKAAADAQADADNLRELYRSAQLEDAAAADTLRQGALLAGLKRMQGSKLVAKQRLAYGASGVDAGVGTPAGVMAETSAIAELDAQTLQNNAVREAWGHTEIGRKYRVQAKQLSDTAASRTLGTFLGMGGTLASTAGSLLGGK